MNKQFNSKLFSRVYRQQIIDFSSPFTTSSIIEGCPALDVQKLLEAM
jgi:hypothetical protein